MIAGDLKKQMLEYQDECKKEITKHVREEQNNIDDVMIKRLKKYSDLDEPTPN